MRFVHLSPVICSSESGERQSPVGLILILPPSPLRRSTSMTFEPYAVSAFAQLLMEKENMMAWNQFISQSEEDQQSFLKSIIDEEEEDDVAGDQSRVGR